MLYRDPKQITPKTCREPNYGPMNALAS
uniref:Uncharacterized protein n=1 Tax=Moniliophthora roreri TaxID=221103 RepID=A0A0W0G0V3_MONRR